jgi:hypothetical protein
VTVNAVCCVVSAESGLERNRQWVASESIEAAQRQTAEKQLADTHALYSQQQQALHSTFAAEQQKLSAQVRAALSRAEAESALCAEWKQKVSVAEAKTESTEKECERLRQQLTALTAAAQSQRADAQSQLSAVQSQLSSEQHSSQLLRAEVGTLSTLLGAQKSESQRLSEAHAQSVALAEKSVQSLQQQLQAVVEEGKRRNREWSEKVAALESMWCMHEAV